MTEWWPLTKSSNSMWGRRPSSILRWFHRTLLLVSLSGLQKCLELLTFFYIHLNPHPGLRVTSLFSGLNWNRLKWNRTDLLGFRNYLKYRPDEEEGGWQNFPSTKAGGLCPGLLGGQLNLTELPLSAKHQEKRGWNPFSGPERARTTE